MKNKITLAAAHNLLSMKSNFARRADRLKKAELAGRKFPRRHNQNTNGLFTPTPVEYKMDVSCKGVYT